MADYKPPEPTEVQKYMLLRMSAGIYPRLRREPSDDPEQDEAARKLIFHGLAHSVPVDDEGSVEVRLTKEGVRLAQSIRYDLAQPHHAEVIELIGLSIRSIGKDQWSPMAICLDATDGWRFRFIPDDWRDEEDCGGYDIELHSVVGDPESILNSPITHAVLEVYDDESPEECPPLTNKLAVPDLFHFRWTILRLATEHGQVTYRWIGNTIYPIQDGVGMGVRLLKSYETQNAPTPAKE